MVHAHCMLDTQGYKYTFRICNIYCYSTATVVMRTCLNVAFIRTLLVLLINNFYGKGLVPKLL